MPAVVRWLEANSTPGAGGGERVSGSRGAGVPTRLEVWSAVLPGPEHVSDPFGDQTGPPSIPTQLGLWARLVAEERRLHGPAGGRVEQVCDFLLAHLEWVAGRPWAGELAGEVGRLRALAIGERGLAPWGRQVVRFGGVPCPSCGLDALMRRAGEDYIECDDAPHVGGCGDLWQAQELVAAYPGEVAEHRARCADRQCPCRTEGGGDGRAGAGVMLA